MGFTARYNWIVSIVTEMFGIRDYMAEVFDFELNNLTAH
jgi:hypothetical protein